MRPGHLTEPRWVRAILLLLALAFLTLFLFVPLAAVFTEALRKAGKPIWRRSPSRMPCRPSA